MKEEEFVTLGYNDEEIFKIVKKNPFVSSLSLENITQKFNNLLMMGYKRNEIIKMTVKFPNLLDLSSSNIESKLKDLEDLGYISSDALYLTMKSPVIFSYSTDKLKNTIKCLEDHCYSKDTILDMTLKYPEIYGQSISLLEEKISFLQSINLDNYIKEYPQRLINSIELVYARYNFYLDNKITLDDKTSKELFFSNKRFFKKYKITKEELLETYPYYRDTVAYETKEQKIDFLISMGYLKEQIDEINKVYPILNKCSIKKLQEKITNFEELGYTKEEVISLTLKYPILFSYNAEQLRIKYQTLESILKEKTKEYTKLYPGLIKMPKEELLAKNDLLNDLDLGVTFFDFPNQLVWSNNIIYARYMFLKDYGINLDKNNCQILFYNHKYFNNAFHITTEELLERYNYDDYLNNKSKVVRVRE